MSMIYLVCRLYLVVPELTQ